MNPRVRQETRGVKYFMFRRNEHPQPHIHCVYAEKEVSIDLEKVEVIVGSLPPKQMKEVLKWVEAHRDQLLERIWGHDFAGIDRVVDVHIGLLRRKLEDDPANPAIIQTVRGVGYKFVGRKR